MLQLRRWLKGNTEGAPGRTQRYGKDSEKARAPFWRDAVQQMHAAAAHGKGAQHGVQMTVSQQGVVQ